MIFGFVEASARGASTLATMEIAEKVMDLDQYLAKLDTLEKFPAHVVPVQRCVAVLLGVAQSIGAGSIRPT